MIFNGAEDVLLNTVLLHQDRIWTEMLVKYQVDEEIHEGFSIALVPGSSFHIHPLPVHVSAATKS